MQWAQTLRTAQITTRVLSGSSADFLTLMAAIEAGQSPEDVVAALPDLPDPVVRRLSRAKGRRGWRCGVSAALVSRYSVDARLPSDFGQWLYAIERMGAIPYRTKCRSERLWLRTEFVRRMHTLYGQPPGDLVRSMQPRHVPPTPYRHAQVGPRRILNCGVIGLADHDGFDTATLSFSIGQAEVTNAQMSVFMAAAGIKWKPEERHARRVGERHSLDLLPAIAHWADASAFAAWAGGRLPTHAEWQCLARAGTVFDSHWAPGSRFRRRLRSARIPGRVRGHYWSDMPYPAHWSDGHPWGFAGVYGNVSEWIGGREINIGLARPLINAARPRSPQPEPGEETVRSIGYGFGGMRTPSIPLIREHPTASTTVHDVGFRVAWDPPAR